MLCEQIDLKTLKVLLCRFEDPRQHLKTLHPIIEIVFLTMVANICGVESWQGIEDFGRLRIDWLRSYLPFSSGIPSRHTIARVFSLIKPAFFESLLAQIARHLSPEVERDLIAIDGKSLNGTNKVSKNKLHLVNAMSIESGLTLSQIACSEKSNEITAIPELISTLQLDGATVTIDAAGCQKLIAKTLRGKGADYILAVKQNQKYLYQTLAAYFEETGLTYDRPELFYETIEKSHGRIDRRICQVGYAPRGPIVSSWQGIHSFAMVINERTKGALTTSQVRYFISSLPPDPNRFSSAIRNHWQIENNLHWTLDVIFREDADLKRKDHAPRNFAAMRKVSLNLLKKFLGKSTGIKRARMHAALSPAYMAEILAKSGLCNSYS